MFVVLIILSATVCVIIYRKADECHVIRSQTVPYTNGRISPRITGKLSNGINKMQNDWNKTNSLFQMRPMDNLKTPTINLRHIYTHQFSANKTEKGNLVHDNRVIRILAWTRKTLFDPTWFGKKCGVADCTTTIPCEFSNNRSLYNVNNVILFHTKHAINIDSLPLFRLPHQYWMTYLRESPANPKQPKVSKPHTAWFNWTIAYTMNADILWPYGMCLPSREKIKKDPSSITDAIRRVYTNRADSIP